MSSIDFDTGMPRPAGPDGVLTGGAIVVVVGLGASEVVGAVGEVDEVGPDGGTVVVVDSPGFVESGPEVGGAVVGVVGLVGVVLPLPVVGGTVVGRGAVVGATVVATVGGVVARGPVVGVVGAAVPVAGCFVLGAGAADFGLDGEPATTGVATRLTTPIVAAAATARVRLASTGVLAIVRLRRGFMFGVRAVA